MKKGFSRILALATVILLIGTLAFYFRKNEASGSLYIRDMAPASSDRSGEAGKVNINTADLDALMTLPGIGETLAERIIAYRDANGPFDSLAALLNVDGIGDGKLESILDRITTGGTT